MNARLRYFQDQRWFRRSDGSLTLLNAANVGGVDALGAYEGREFDWVPTDTYWHTSYRTYTNQVTGVNDVAVFKQDFRNREQVKVLLLNQGCVRIALG